MNTFVLRSYRLWQIATLEHICWKARLILALLAIGAILDWMR